MKPTDMLNLFNLPTPFRIIKFNDERGREHVFELGTQGVVDSSCDVWMGDIWEVRNTYVQPTGYGPAGGHELAGNGFVGMNLPPTVTINANGDPVGVFPATLSGGGMGGTGGDFW